MIFCLFASQDSYEYQNEIFHYFAQGSREPDVRTWVAVGMLLHTLLM